MLEVGRRRSQDFCSRDVIRGRVKPCRRTAFRWRCSCSLRAPGPIFTITSITRSHPERLVVAGAAEHQHPACLQPGGQGQHEASGPKEPDQKIQTAPGPSHAPEGQTECQSCQPGPRHTGACRISSAEGAGQTGVHPARKTISLGLAPMPPSAQPQARMVSWRCKAPGARPRSLRAESYAGYATASSAEGQLAGEHVLFRW